MNTSTTQTSYSTAEAAAALKLKPQTLRAAFCRDGHYLNARPAKAGNRFLKWDAGEIDRLAAGGTIAVAAE